MRTTSIDALQMRLDFIVADTPQKRAGRIFTRPSLQSFRHFIEDSDWDERLPAKYGKAADLLCWGIVIASIFFFARVGLSILL
jgi:hypothetical protein